MPEDFEDILEKARGARQDKVTVSYYLSKKLVKKFKAVIKDNPASPVVEELIRRFVEQAEQARKEP